VSMDSTAEFIRLTREAQARSEAEEVDESVVDEAIAWVRS